MPEQLSSGSTSLPGGLYAAALTLAQPLLPYYLQRRVRAGKEEALRLDERYGLATRKRPDGRLLWIHGASVGETLSVLPLLQRLLDLNPEMHILITSGTRASAELLARRLPVRAFHQYVPLDVPAYARRFLDHWRPDAALWLESELWPSLLGELKKRAIPTGRVNARLSPGSAASWSRLRGWLRQLSDCFTLTLPLSEADAQRMVALGLNPQPLAGNLKFTAPAPGADPGELAELKHTIGARPVWLMASTHPGEDEIARLVHQQLSSAIPHLLTMIVPRHPGRADDIEMMLGGAVPRRARGEWPRPDQAYYLGDTIGEMGLFYRAVPVVCVGGSFVPKGGHNPLEAAQCNCAVLIGPDTGKCQDIADELKQAGALRQVTDVSALTRELAVLLTHPDQRRSLQQAGLATSMRQESVLQAHLLALSPLLEPCGIRTT